MTAGNPILELSRTADAAELREGSVASAGLEAWPVKAEPIDQIGRIARPHKAGWANQKGGLSLSSLNKVILIGRVVAQPELRYTPQGTPLAKFALAVDRPKGPNNEKETDFINIVAWRRLAEICNEYLQKGKLVCITGALRTRTYETQDGQKRKDFEIQADDMQMLSPREGGGPPPQVRERVPEEVKVGAGAGGNWSQEKDNGGFNHDDIGMDDVPF